MTISMDLGNSDCTMYSINTNAGVVRIQIPAGMDFKDTALAMCLLNTVKADIMNAALDPLKSLKKEEIPIRPVRPITY